ncbi:amino acid adenylation domain-containing protein [Blautia obeum]|uniref:Phenyloxazoline synthase MbtB n=1 Tax=Blautia obeum TaxID=40520 RepID=A0A174S6E9_9FIRM|nr:amino acid adenylation domain-containing protein [Blautia obeum]CUP91497.1 Phenyloxazoline synthase MbtB [Blautia obeum]
MFNKISISTENWNKICEQAKKHSLKGSELLKAVFMKIKYIWGTDEYKSFFTMEWQQIFDYISNKDSLAVSSSISIEVMDEEKAEPYILIETNGKANLSGDIGHCISKIITQMAQMDLEDINISFLTEEQKNRRCKLNDTCKEYHYKGLHEEFFETAECYPEKTAIIWYDEMRENITYAQLADKVLRMANMLTIHGISENEYIAVSIPKGPWQIISVLAVLSVGCTYVPIDIEWPEERKKKICKKANIKNFITITTYSPEVIEGIDIIYADESEHFEKIKDFMRYEDERSAYVIFTSGTTGEPKGVEISHKSADNTIKDINYRFGISSKDKCFAISELSFDLSVYDIFGMLAEGGTIVLPRPKERKMADRWFDIVINEQITIWNSVPAIYDMFLMVAENSTKTVPLKKVLLSGDWVQPTLYDRNKKITSNCEFISLGGATEAAIWSVYYVVNEVRSDWNSVPYGYPLANQKVIIMNTQNQECPDDVPGELWIGGMGVAKGYINEPDLTEEKFVFYNGKRWYRTGDLVSFTKDGHLEFLGRIDHQIKLNGYRIELKEIEKNINQSKYVDKNIALIIKKNGYPRLVGAIKPYIPAIKMQSCSIEDNGTFDDETSRVRETTVNLFLQEVLKQVENDSITICRKMQILYELWKKRLIQKQEVSVQKQVVDTCLWKVLKNMLPLYLDILSGKAEPNELLKYPEFNPEYLTFKSPAVNLFLNKIVDTIKATGKNNRIGIIQARTGKVATVLSRQTEGQEYILFDSSAGMLDIAQGQNAQINNCLYSMVRQGGIERKYVGYCDFVVAVNTMHQFENKNEGLKLANMLLKPNGKLMMIECADEDAMALITSYVLEAEKVETNKFYLQLKDWGKLLGDAGFEMVKAEMSEVDNIEYIEAFSRNDFLHDCEKGIFKILEENLPKYMIPEEFYYFVNLPLSTNGKIDRNKILRSIEMQEDYFQNDVALTDSESRIAKIWKDILGAKNISKSISFFEAGGDSLLSTKLMMELRKEYNVEVALTDIFENPYLEQMASMLDKKIDAENAYVEGEI